ncbi:MAG: porin family protein [Cyclobacteriaceae bacterium]
MAVSLAAEGQSFFKKRKNVNYDEKLITYGFSIGIHTSAYQIQYSDQFVTNQLDTVHSVMAEFSPGFSLGFLINYRFNEFLDLRLMPKFGFYEHRLQYNYTDESIKTQLVETTMVELPILLKYKSMRRGNVRMYMVGGVTPAFEASGKNDITGGNSDLAIDIKPRNLTLEAGLGFDFYFPMFKLSQEIRFQHGIVDMLGAEPGPFREPLKRLNTNAISVYFIFQ